ncbi:rho GDP-dissociation inhibitor 1-like [Macadamia integrifolia]|uniref:rho GDP-dissociation inhibitor 1-like n=1 Tax=Macadamia integrifolia TaxID=60698 RepID=UPI001C50222D|nr:rho GDP-dissociation inhibitor 1-like [Macadamia integrifolia]XP_042504373.1 rho GDP-dissociation inhibitor 1-like [Macadamia integrifolia]XP_042504374.1 rho GDP-dissociation inhibitor 1-like [Macadamia integrifolia]XP_042504375.1 rho GDP-dissociation inhibitor 1-like [Macadamia integrifolia]
MSAVMGSLSSFQAIPFNTAGMEKEEEKTNNNSNSGAKQSEENAEKLKREYSCASNCSTENGYDDDPEDDDDAKSKVGKEELDLGPQFSLKEQLEKDKDDESLRRWKEQLLGSVDINAVGENADPEVQILSLTILSPDRPNLVLPIPFVPNSKGHAFALKDGCRYRLKFSFVVSNNIVSGLKYTNTVWKTGVRVNNRKVMLGTFSPQQEPYTYDLEEDTTPSGIFARGSYSARTKLVDDDGKCYLDINYSFEIRKEWPSSTS